MAKLLFITLLLSNFLIANSLPNIKQTLPPGMDMLAIKALMVKKPNELEPDVSIMIGNIFQNGMQELGVKKNTQKAKIYYKSGAIRGVLIGNLLLANLALEEKDIKTYIKEMEFIIKANDYKLSIPAGLQLAAFWASINNKKSSIETLIYIATIYDDPRAQFMVGWSITTKEFIPNGMTQDDGQQFLYQACTNPTRTKEIQTQCDKYTNK